VLAAPPLAASLGRRGAEATGEDGGADGEETIPLEWVGILRPFTDDDRKGLDVALGHSGGVSRGAA